MCLLWFHLLQVMGHRVWGMFASAGRSRGVGALHSIWQQKDCQWCLWWVSSVYIHTNTPPCQQSLFCFWLCHISTYSKIKVWDLQAALDPRAPASTLCLRTLVVSVSSFFFFFLFFFGLLPFMVLDVHVILHDSQHGESVLQTSNIHVLCVFWKQNFLIAFPGAFRPRFPPPVWWVSDHQQFSWWYHSHLGFPERLTQWPIRGPFSFPHLHVHF